MAFGSWFKNIVKKTGQFINKLKPIIGTAVKIARDVVAPTLSTIGNQIGGPAGNTLRMIGDGTQKFTDKISSKTNQWVQNEVSQPNNVWVPNERAKGFNMPLLK